MTEMVFDALADLALLEEARARYRFDDVALRKALGVTDRNCFRQWRHRNAVPMGIRSRLLDIVVTGEDWREHVLRLAESIRGLVEGQGARVDLGAIPPRVCKGAPAASDAKAAGWPSPPWPSPPSPRQGPTAPSAVNRRGRSR